MNRTWTRHPRSRTFCISRVARWRRILHCGFRLRKKSTVVWPAQSTAPYRHTPLSMNRYIGLVHPPRSTEGGSTRRRGAGQLTSSTSQQCLFRKIPWGGGDLACVAGWLASRARVVNPRKFTPIANRRRRFPTSPEPELTHSGKSEAGAMP